MTKFCRGATRSRLLQILWGFSIGVSTFSAGISQSWAGWLGKDPIRVSPEFGHYKGGTVIQITGLSEDEPPVVLIGGQPCLDVVLKKKPKAIECTTPPHWFGSFDIWVRSEKKGYVKVENKFDYVVAAVMDVSHETLWGLTGQKTKIPTFGRPGPFKYQIVSGAGEMMDAEDSFMSSDTPGVTQIEIRDSKDHLTFLTFITHPKTQTIPKVKSLFVGESFEFVPSWGVPPHTIELKEGGGKIFDGNRLYLAPDQPGEALIRITDSLLQTADVKINITARPGPIAKESKLAVGWMHTCAEKKEKVYCWGDNDSGQLGNNSDKKSYTPVLVRDLKGPITTLVAGAKHACAIDAGVLKCWGNNQYGQLGDGTTTEKHTPVPVLGMEGVLAVVSGDYHMCGVTWQGLFCWGRNDQGQVGSTFEASSPFPILVKPLPQFVNRVFAGNNRSCVSLDEGVSCWGNAQWAKTRAEKPKFHSAPLLIKDLEDVDEMAFGWIHACSLSAGRVRCWGYHDLGGIGSDPAENVEDSETPTEVVGAREGVTAIGSGQHHTCAIKSQKAYCWGYNYHGELGDGTRQLRKAATPVIGTIGSLIEIDAGTAHTCARTISDEVYCWGENTQGQLGDGSRMMKTSPVKVNLR